MYFDEWDVQPFLQSCSMPYRTDAPFHTPETGLPRVLSLRGEAQTHRSRADFHGGDAAITPPRVARFEAAKGDRQQEIVRKYSSLSYGYVHNMVLRRRGRRCARGGWLMGAPMRSSNLKMKHEGAIHLPRRMANGLPDCRAAAKERRALLVHVLVPA